MTAQETHPVGTDDLVDQLRYGVQLTEAAELAADRIEQLEAALTRANAATAAAYEVGDIIVDVVKGVEGPSLYMQDYRVSGPKPWGGGKKIHTFKVDQKDLRRALATPDQTAALDRLIAEAEARTVERIAELISGWRNTTPMTGEECAIAILAASKKGGV